MPNNVSFLFFSLSDFHTRLCEAREEFSSSGYDVSWTGTELYFKLNDLLVMYGFFGFDRVIKVTVN